jgi:hypothetical protein
MDIPATARALEAAVANSLSHEIALSAIESALRAAQEAALREAAEAIGTRFETPEVFDIMGMLRDRASRLAQGKG